MKMILLCLSLLVVCGCAGEKNGEHAAGTVDVSLHEIRYRDDARVVHSALVEAVTPVAIPAESLRALMLPFAVRQDIAVRRDIGREMGDIFRLTWLEKRVFQILQYDGADVWPGLEDALARARKQNANILVTGNLSQFYQAAAVGRTNISLTVEIYWVPDGTLLWSAAQAGAMEGAPDTDYALVRTVRRLPDNPTYAVMRSLAESMATGFRHHLAEDGLE